MSNRWVPYFLQVRKAIAAERALNRHVEILNRWDAGENYVDLAHEFGWKPWRLRQFIESCNRPEPKPPTEDELAVRRVAAAEMRYRNFKIETLRDLGKTWRAIAEECRISPERCRQIYLRRKGVKPARLRRDKM